MKSRSPLNLTLVYQVVQFGDETDPDPELTVKEHVENPDTFNIVTHGNIQRYLTLEETFNYMFNINNRNIYVTCER